MKNTVMKIRSLSAELEIIAKTKLNENDENKEEKITEIKEWIVTQPHLNSNISDQEIINYLRGCKYKMDVVKHKLDMYQTIKTICPEIFQNRDPTVDHLQEWIKTGTFLPLMNRTDAAGPMFMFFRCCYDPKLNILEGFKYAFLVYDLLVYEYDNVPVSGLILILDLRDMTYAHLRQYTPNFLIKFAKIFFKALPIRLKAVYIINPPTGFIPLIEISKFFSPEKIRDRYFIFRKVDDVYKHISQENFPLEYGGKAGTLDELINFWQKKISDHRDWFRENEKIRSNENLRPGGPKSAESVFNICSIM